MYGHSLAFMLTGEERYLGYARAGIDWIDAKAKDPGQRRATSASWTRPATRSTPWQDRVDENPSGSR